MADLVNLLQKDVYDGTWAVQVPDVEVDRALRGHVSELRNIDPSTLRADHKGSSLLQFLDPARHTISYLFVLLARLEGGKKQPVTDQDLVPLSDFLRSYSGVQARYAGPEWRQLLEWTETQLLPLISTAILRMDPSSSTFTSSHLTFVRLCLEAAAPRQALPILDKDTYSMVSDSTEGVDEQHPCAETGTSSSYITRASGISGAIRPEHVQEYHLIGAQIYLGLRNYSRARLFLELVLSTPTEKSAVDPYMIEAYKKLVLLGLIVRGQPYKISQLQDQAAVKTISQLSKPYDALADAFKRRDLQKFNAETDVGVKFWDEDGNAGLVEQAAESLRRYRIKDLQKTYVSLSIDHIASILSLSTQSTTDLLARMIQDGHFDAAISERDQSGLNGTTDARSSAVLRFHKGSVTQSAQTDSDIDRQIQAQLLKIETLNNSVREANRKLAVSHEWTDHVRKAKKNTDAGAAAFEDPMDVSWGGAPGDAEDEDMMGDLR